jgi:flagellar motor protein MotB
MKETKLMRLTRLLSASALSLLLGTTALLYAQEQHEDAKPQDEPRPEASKPAQDDTKTPRQDEAKPQKQEDKDKAGQAEDKAAKKDDAAQQAQRASNQGGGRIPDDKFRAHFGRQHTFVINHVTTVGGQPQFQYGGYSFTMVEAWPMGWAYTDQCYIDYINGQYFLFDLLHPGVQVALVVVL